MSSPEGAGWNPVPAGMFRVEIDGVPAGGFAACRGLGAYARYLALREGGAESPRFFRDAVTWEPIRLERGLVSNRALWEWFSSGEPKNGSIVLVAPDGSEAGRWTFLRGRPARWWAPELDAAADSVAVEAVEIVHEGLRCETR